MRIIGHLDMDAFFASVEERDHKWLKGKAVIVGADPKDGKGRGVVSTANYKAREYGIHSALPISKAWQFCEEARKKGKPQCFFLGGNFAKYGEVSRKIMEIISRFSPKIEQASVDEAYFEFLENDWAEAKRSAEKIKKEIKSKEKLSCSIGIGPNKLIAKIASDFKKPDGLTLVKEEEAEEFLENMAIRKIPGVGPKTEAMFFKIGIKKISDAKQLSKKELEEILGKWGFSLYYKIRGQDDSPVAKEREAKSISEENTFEEDTLEAGILMKTLDDLCAGVFKYFNASEFKSFRTVTLKIRFENFETKTRANTLEEPKKDLQTLKKEAMKLFLPFLDSRENPRRKKIRLLGIRVGKFNT